jgi:hypothetical protein
MWFDKLEGVKQLLALRDLVEFDFDGNKAQYERLFKLRTAVNSDRDREQAAANSIEIGKDAPGERVDETALTAELESAGAKNVDIERRRANRENASIRVQQLRHDIEARVLRCDNDVAEINRQIQELIAKIGTVQEESRLAVLQMNKEAGELQAKLDNADPLPDVVDASAISAKLNEARRVNRLIDDWEAQRARKAGHQREADTFSKQSDGLTAQLAELQRAKQDAILKANLPIDGLGFGDDHVTLHGAPWPQASEAQRIDASMAIAMAHKPKLRTILIRHASGVGSKIRERIRERAHERGYRVIMEIYDETGANSHIFVEDGLVKKIDGQEIPPQEPAPTTRDAGATMEQEPELTAVTQPASDSANQPQESPKPKPRKWQGPGAPKGDVA